MFFLNKIVVAYDLCFWLRYTNKLNDKLQLFEQKLHIKPFLLHLDLSSDLPMYHLRRILWLFVSYQTYPVTFLLGSFDDPPEYQWTITPTSLTITGDRKSVDTAGPAKPPRTIEMWKVQLVRQPFDKHTHTWCICVFGDYCGWLAAIRLPSAWIVFTYWAVLRALNFRSKLRCASARLARIKWHRIFYFFGPLHFFCHFEKSTKLVVVVVDDGGGHTHTHLDKRRSASALPQQWTRTFFAHWRVRPRARDCNNTVSMTLANPSAIVRARLSRAVASSHARLIRSTMSLSLFRSRSRSLCLKTDVGACWARARARNIVLRCEKDIEY